VIDVQTGRSFAGEIHAGEPAQQTDGADFLSAFEYFQANPARSAAGR
jgi:hypothetical protein